MSKDDLTNAITLAVEGAVEKTVPPTVERVVNGKIALIQQTLDTYIEREQEHKSKVIDFMNELMPIKEGVRTIVSLNRFIKWLGLPALGAFIMWFFFR